MRNTLVVLVALSLAACSGTPAAAPGPSEGARLTGVARYREKILLPPETLLTAQVIDLSRSGVVLYIAGTAEVRIGSANPAAFEVVIPAWAWSPDDHYELSVAITAGARAWTMQKAMPVLTGGSPSHADVTLQAALVR